MILTNALNSTLLTLAIIPDYNWLNNNENQGFDYSCFERLIESGWTGDIKRLRNALNTNYWFVTFRL